MRLGYKTLVILCMAVLVAGCRQDRLPREGFRIGVSQCSDDLWRRTVNSEMLREASFYPGVTLDIRTVSDDTPRQIEDINQLIDSGIDLLVVAPNEAEALTPVVSRAYEAGIPVILLDRKISNADYTAYIGGDNYRLGYELGLYAAEVLEGAGNVVEIRGWEGSTADDERHRGFTDAVLKFPGIGVVAERRGDFLRETAREQMSGVLREYPGRIDLVFAMNDQMALGVHDAAINYSGKRPFIVGIDALAGEGGGIESIRKGLIDASFMYPTGGDRVVELALRILRGEDFQRENILHTAVVDRSNARVIQLQTDQIVQHQEKIDRVNSMLSNSLAEYANQRTLLWGAVALIVLTIAVLILLVVAFARKNRTNRQLERQNREITEQARVLAEQKEQLIELSHQLEEATHAKLVFFTNISHEFRTPLTLILGPVEAMLDSPDIGGRERELLALVRRNSERLLTLITQILEFRSFENGKLNTHFTRGDMRGFLERFNEPFADHARRRRVGFSFTAEDDDFTASFDREKVETIYFNLLSNAFKNTPEGCSVRVALKRETTGEGDWLCLSVFNEGRAIPPEKLEEIFERFFKANPNDVGTGIGLALTRSLVEVHGGRIGVESREGEGTTFTVHIPVEQPGVADETADEWTAGRMLLGAWFETETPASHAEELLSDEKEAGDKPIALVIEDNADLRRFVKMILSDEYVVVEAEDGGPGIEKARKYIPDIVISDVMMPGVDGFGVCRALKAGVSTSHIPIILLTACSLDEQKAMGFEEGADAYIPKPFNANLLRIRVRKLIEGRRKMKEDFGHSLLDTSRKETVAETEQAFIDRFRECVLRNLSDNDLGVDDIARETGMSRVQLYRKVKSLTGYAPNELIRIIRLRHAAGLLAGGTVTVSEAAYESGFSSPSYFTKCFRDFFGVSPTEYKGT